MISNTAALNRLFGAAGMFTYLSERDLASSLPVYAGTWPAYQSDFFLGGVAQLLLWGCWSRVGETEAEVGGCWL